MSSTPEFNEAQLAAARSNAWHQTGAALLTLEDVKAWVAECGIVLFAPGNTAMTAAAPSLVEATLGATNAAPTAADTDMARGFLARMIADGTALPLNLLGGPGDVPDFVVSTQVFPYVFTMRGDKGWKQPPSTSGAVKVSPLALKVYETLAERGAMTAAELVSELGREVTEAAIGRSLVELWSQLRAVPLLQQGDGTTMWELTTRRFTKAIKSGANAGQPTALSALVSLYLAQVFGATEEEIETFLSPLTSRSRVREVLHALTSGRQLETVVVAGKTLLHIPGALPEFPAEAATELPGTADGVASTPASEEGTRESGRPRERIRRFEGQRPSARSTGPRRDAGATGDRRRSAGGERPSGFRGKPAGERFGHGRPSGPRREFGAGKGEKRTGAGAAGFTGKPERERRPFRRDEPAGERPSFNKPWDEDRKARPERGPSTGAFKGASRGGARDETSERRPRRDTPARDSGPRTGAAGKFGGSGDRPQRRSFNAAGSDRPERPRSNREGFAPRGGAERPRPFRRREEGEGDAGQGPGAERAGRPPRRDTPFRERPGGGRPDRPGGGAGRSFGGGADGKREGGRSFGAGRSSGGEKRFGAGVAGSAASRGAGKSFGGSKPGFKSSRPAFGGKPGFKSDRPASGGKPRSDRPAFGDRAGSDRKPGFKSGFGGKKPGFKSNAGFGGKRDAGPRRGASGGSRPTPRKPKPESEE